MCDLKLNLWADIFRNELVPWIHIRHFRRRARVHYEKLSLIFNGHIKYNFIMCVWICKLVVSISFLKPPIYGTIWVTRMDTDGYFYHSSCRSHPFTHSHSAAAVICLLNNNNDDNGIRNTNTLRMRIHVSIRTNLTYIHVWMCIPFDSIRFDPIRFMVFPRLLVIYFIIILCFMISIRSNWINKNKLIFSVILFAS